MCPKRYRQGAHIFTVDEHIAGSSVLHVDQETSVMTRQKAPLARRLADIKARRLYFTHGRKGSTKPTGHSGTTIGAKVHAATLIMDTDRAPAADASLWSMIQKGSGASALAGIPPR